MEHGGECEVHVFNRKLLISVLEHDNALQIFYHMFFIWNEDIPLHLMQQNWFSF